MVLKQESEDYLGEEEVHERVEVGIRDDAKIINSFPSTVTRYMVRKSPKKTGCSSGSRNPNRRTCATNLFL